MAGVLKTSPAIVTNKFESIGKSITWFNIVFAVDPTASTGPLGAIQAVKNAVQNMGIVIAAGPLSATKQSMGIEGIFAAEDLSAMELQIQEMGTIDGVDLSGVTVVAKELEIA